MQVRLQVPDIVFIYIRNLIVKKILLFLGTVLYKDHLNLKKNKQTKHTPELIIMFDHQGAKAAFSWNVASMVNLAGFVKDFRCPIPTVSLVTVVNSSRPFLVNCQCERKRICHTAVMCV